MLFFIFLLTASVSVFAQDFSAQIQNISQQQQEEKRMKEINDFTKKDNTVKITDNKKKDLQSEKCKQIDVIEFSGNQKISTSKLKKIAFPYLQKCLTGYDIETILQESKQQYAKKGMLLPIIGVKAGESIVGNKLIIFIEEDKVNDVTIQRDVKFSNVAYKYLNYDALFKYKNKIQ